MLRIEIGKISSCTIIQPQLNFADLIRTSAIRNTKILRKRYSSMKIKIDRVKLFRDLKAYIHRDSIRFDDANKLLFVVHLGYINFNMNCTGENSVDSRSS